MPKVAIVKTRPETVLDDIQRAMRLSDYRAYLSPERDTLLKLNLSWTRFFPACSSTPWQLEGVVRTLIEDGFSPERLIPIENKTVVTDPRRGAANNRWQPVFERYGLQFLPLTEVEWGVRRFQEPLLMLDRIFPHGIEVPKLFEGRQVLHLPTMKTHGHSTTTGAVKNAFGGLLKEVRHYAHKHIHEVLVDLLILQKELHPGLFAVMDGTVAGDGAGPRTMEPRVVNYLLASGDSVAIDAVAARMMGFDPLSIPYLRMAAERGLGTADLREMELVGDDIAGVDFGFRVKRSFVIRGDQMIRKGWLRPLERLLLHSPMMAWAPFASNIYHDYYWYPTHGRRHVRAFMETPWGQLFERYALPLGEKTSGAVPRQTSSGSQR